MRAGIGRAVAPALVSSAILSKWPPPLPTAASDSACGRKAAAVNDRSDPLLSKEILHLILQNDGKLNWFEIVAAIGIRTMERRYECIDGLRLLEGAGIIRSEVSDSGVRFWIVKPAEPV
jgi:hypothetical protein